MATNNADNISSAGLVKYDGAGTFAGVTVTQHDLLIGAASNGITSVAPSATSGVPVISQGASADPAFGTAVVAGGGTGVASATAYAVLCGGTTTTNPFQSIASVGTSGQILTSNGASALPTFQAASGVGGSLTLIQTQNASNVATISFTTGITSTYRRFIMLIDNMQPVTTSTTLTMQVSTDGGSNYLNTGYVARVNVTNSSAVFASASNTTAFQLSFTTDISNSSTLKYNAMIVFYDFTTGGTPAISGIGTYQSVSASSPDYVYQYGYGPVTITVNAFQFAMSSGNINTGTFSLYGVSN